MTFIVAFFINVVCCVIDVSVFLAYHSPVTIAAAIINGSLALLMLALEVKS